MTNLNVKSYYLGSARASVWQAVLEDQSLPGVRSTTQQDIDRLYKAFNLQGDHRSDRRNFATAQITESLWLQALARNNIPASATQDPCHEPPYLELLPSETFICVKGRTRVHVARRFNPTSEQWWSFDYYSADMSAEEQYALRTQCYNGRPFSGGEIYRNLRYCQIHLPALSSQWLSRLTKTHQNNVNQLANSNKPLQRAFDGVLPLIGVWEDFPLGALHRINTAKVNVEMIRYLCKLKEMLMSVTLTHPEKLDVETVRLIELLTPAASTRDRERLRQLHKDRQIFQLYSRQQQRQILDRLLKIKGRILSLKSFVLDTIALDTWSKAVRMILPPLKRNSEIETLFHDCYHPEETQCFTEVAEGNYEVLVGVSSDVGFRHAYVHPWLWSARHFPEATGIPPKKDAGAARLRCEPNEAALPVLATRAHRQGFVSQHIEHLRSLNPLLEVTRGYLKRIKAFRSLSVVSSQRLESAILSLLDENELNEEFSRALVPCYSTDVNEVPLAHRAGLPTSKMLENDRPYLFYPILKDDTVPETTVRLFASSLFIIRDIFQCFFGVLSPDRDLSEVSSGDETFPLDSRGSSALSSASPVIEPSQNSWIEESGHEGSLFYEWPSEHSSSSSLPSASDSAVSDSLLLLYILPECELHQLQRSDLALLQELADNDYAMLIGTPNGCPRYVDLNEVHRAAQSDEEEQLQVVLVHKKGIRGCTVSEAGWLQLNIIFDVLASLNRHYDRDAWARLFQRLFEQPYANLRVIP